MTHVRVEETQKFHFVPGRLYCLLSREVCELEHHALGSIVRHLLCGNEEHLGLGSFSRKVLAKYFIVAEVGSHLEVSANFIIVSKLYQLSQRIILSP